MKPRFRQKHIRTFMGLQSQWVPMNQAAQEMENLYYYRKGLAALKIINPKYAQN